MASRARLDTEARNETELDAQVSELLKRTRTERGLTLVIDDPTIIAKLARIVAAGGDS